MQPRQALPLHVQLRRELGVGDLVLFNTAAVVGIRWLAAAAHIGSGSLMLWVSAAALFFVPCAIAVAALARRFPEQGGLYIWTREAFGEWHAFLCAWCYWLNNFFYLPSLAIAGVTMALYSMGPPLDRFVADTGVVTAAALGLLWIATAANLLGLRAGKWLANIGGTATYLAAAILILGGAAAWIARGGPATPLELFPPLDAAKLNFWPQIAFAFGGLELGAVLGGEIRDPERTLPRAAWLSGAAIATFYIAGTVGMLTLLPATAISPVTGLAQAGAALGWRPMALALSILVVLGIAGQLNTWLGGVARIPVVLGADHYLPARFTSLGYALVAQALVCTVCLLAMQAGENLRTGYQLLVDMMVITYFVPFLYLFLAAWRVAGLRLSALAGLLVTILALALSFVPPDGVASPWLFEAKLIAGAAVVFALARYWFARKRKRSL
jgi:glutamate:GABA antiporter